MLPLVFALVLFATPAIGLTVEPSTVWVLNSDPRITDVRLHINDAVIPVRAPLHELQPIAFSTPCGLTDVTIYGEVVSDDPALAGVLFDRIQTTITHECNTRVYLPLL